jgi:starch synthase (maltosyl-transferring)
VQSGWLNLDLEALGIDPGRPYTAHDELSGDTFEWHGANPWVRLDPSDVPGHVFALSQTA